MLLRMAADRGCQRVDMCVYLYGVRARENKRTTWEEREKKNETARFNNESRKVHNQRKLMKFLLVQFTNRTKESNERIT